MKRKLCWPLNQGDFFVIERSAKFFDPKTLEELEIAQKANEIIGDLGGTKYHVGDYYIKELPQIIPQKDYYSVYARNSFYVFSQYIRVKIAKTTDATTEQRMPRTISSQSPIRSPDAFWDSKATRVPIPTILNPTLVKTYRLRPNVSMKKRAKRKCVPDSFKRLL